MWWEEWWTDARPIIKEDEWRRRVRERERQTEWCGEEGENWKKQAEDGPAHDPWEHAVKSAEVEHNYSAGADMTLIWCLIIIILKKSVKDDIHSQAQANLKPGFNHAQVSQKEEEEPSGSQNIGLRKQSGWRSFQHAFTTRTFQISTVFSPAEMGCTCSCLPICRFFIQILTWVGFLALVLNNFWHFIEVSFKKSAWT